MIYTETNSHPLLRFLDKEEILALKKTSRTHDFIAHEVIIRVNDRNRDMISIDEGSVSIQIESIEGKVIEVDRIHDGNLIGEMNFVIPTRRTANVVAITEIEATIYPYKELTDLLKAEPIIAAKIFAAINHSLVDKYLSTAKRLQTN